MRRSTTLFAVAAVGLAAAALAGCGSSSGTAASGGYSGGSSNGATTATSGTAVATIAVASSSLGRILDNATGRTVYLFEKDTGNTSTCYGACATDWPPVTTASAPKAGQGAAMGELGTSKRRDGTLQVTYAGHPLYTYAGDTASGQANGEGLDAFGAEWYAVEPTGDKVENDDS